MHRWEIGHPRAFFGEWRMENETMQLATMSAVEYDDLDPDDSRDDYRVELGAIRLGPAGEQLWKEGNTEFRAMVKAMANLLLGVFGVLEIEILSSDRSCRHLVDRVVSRSPVERHGWYSWFETSGCWEIVWGSRYRAVVEGSSFTIYRYGKAGTDRPEAIEGCLDGRKTPEERLRETMAFVEGYLRARTPKGLAEWKTFSGRGVRGSVLVKGG